MGFVKAARLEDIPESDGFSVRIREREIGLFRVDGTVYAIDNVCPHRGGPLHEGIVKDCVITCPWHDWSFDLRSGQCTFHNDLSIETFDVRLEGENVMVRFDETS